MILTTVLLLRAFFSEHLSVIWILISSSEQITPLNACSEIQNFIEHFTNVLQIQNHAKYSSDLLDRQVDSEKENQQNKSICVDKNTHSTFKHKTYLSAGIVYSVVALSVTKWSFSGSFFLNMT